MLEQILSFGLVLGLVGCSTASFSKPVTLGAAGTAVGAGTGALIGTLIANGDVAASAVVGAGAGAIIGIVAGYTVQEMEKAEIARIDQEIRLTQQEIDSRQREIDYLHQKQLDDSQRGEPDESMRSRMYDGPTLGNRYR